MSLFTALKPYLSRNLVKHLPDAQSISKAVGARDVVRRVRRESGRSAQRSPAKIVGEVVAGTVLVGAGGLLAYWLRERSQPEAEYRIVRREGPFSLRRYSPMVVATTIATGSMPDALQTGFRRLFAYISGKEEGRGLGADTGTIAMTTPVTATPAEHPGSWHVRFIMPPGNFRSTLPDPGPGISIEEIPGRLVAAVRFPGRVQDRQLARNRHEDLLAWVKARGLHATSDAEFAGFNAPIVPGPVRRNEWWVPVSDRVADTPIAG